SAQGTSFQQCLAAPQIRCHLSVQQSQVLGPEWQQVQARYLHTLGNLTLTGYNSEYSDRPFADKRDMEGGFKDSPLRLNAGLGQIETWNADTIEARAAQLAAKAVTIWPRPTLSAQELTAFREPREETGYTVEDHPYLLPPQRRALFEKFRSHVLGLDPAVTEHFLKLYIAYKTETNFVDIVPQVSRMRLTLNMPFEALHDERGLAKDITGLGKWGNGNIQVTLDESSDFTYIMGLVRQAFEYQMGE
ncbi:GmrSD restriction endonuclease domain-containing protein, partial [Lolliginicoccus levis]|uniref:GmrSD restriction endonuclease domain-containing protein n=1 Tax=Lolliginicoccus levis TaxID=2919542 RepID=UPI00241E7CA2